MVTKDVHDRLLDTIEQYLSGIACQGYSQGTVEGYRNNLYQFVRLLHVCATVKQYTVTSMDEACSENRLIDTVMQRRDDNPLISAFTIRRYMSAWRGYIKYLTEYDILPVSFVRFKFNLPKLPFILPKAITMPLLDKLLDSDPKNWIGLRNRCIYELMAYSGLRISEVLDLQLFNVSLADRRILVFGKGKRERMVPITRCAADRIRQYLHMRHRLIDTQSGYLFVNRYGGRLSDSTVRQQLSGLAAEVLCTDSTRITPHMLRHSCATYFVRKTHDLRFVQLLLGHKNIATTQAYVHLDLEHISNLFDQNHDRHA